MTDFERAKAAIQADFLVPDVIPRYPRPRPAMPAPTCAVTNVHSFTNVHTLQRPSRSPTLVTPRISNVPDSPTSGLARMPNVHPHLQVADVCRTTHVFEDWGFVPT